MNSAASASLHRVLPLITMVGLAACTGGRDPAGPEGQLAWQQPVARAAQCGADDPVEPGLQGQVPLADRESGRSQDGYACNLELVSRIQGDGAAWQFAWYEDCAYHSTAYFADLAGNRDNIGVAVVDVADSENPQVTRYLDSASMLDPWESLKVNVERQLLGGVNGIGGGGGPEIDLYDLSGDCADPQLIVSAPPAGGDDSDTGHAGDFAPDGRTYYAATRAIDIADPADPRYLTDIFGLTHDLSISADGNRAYLAQIGAGGYPPNNGLMIVDVSEVQSREPDPVTYPVGFLHWEDGSLAQNTQPITIDGNPYILFTDEMGPFTLATLVVNGTAPRDLACAHGLAPFAMGRIIDISNENLPTLASKLMLEIHDPANCDQTLADVAGTGIFQYDAHYCTADDPKDTTAVACGHFQSGIRVFDVRDPYQPREIAYFNPPAQEERRGTLYGSHHDSREGSGRTSLTADWCAANVRFVKERGELWTSCQDNGFLVLKFTNGVWPFPES